MKAPMFTLPDSMGTTHSLEDFKGKWVILYFYPKDNTPGCTKEACSFRDNAAEFTAKNAVILGVSKDSVSSHKKFSDTFSLSFPLLSDERLETIKAYGAWGKKKFMGKEFDGILRSTVLIDPSGEIVKRYEKVDPVAHASEILQDLDEFSK
jgi:peroxiredoxin Q/BCP